LKELHAETDSNGHTSGLGNALPEVDPLAISTILEGLPIPVSAPIAVELLTLRFAGIGAMPVLLANGLIELDVLEWLKFQKLRKMKSQSSLYRYAISVRLLWEFCQNSETRPASVPILGAFFEARVHGYPKIGWAPVSVSSAKQNLVSIALFLDWYSDTYKVHNPHPKVEVPRHWTELLQEHERRRKEDTLAHLFPSTKRSHQKLTRAFPYTARADRGSVCRIARPKAFRFDDYMLLLKHEENPRNKMAWLLLGAGGCRVCEPLNSYLSDVGCDPQTGQCTILLADPVYGPAFGKGDERSFVTRKSYLESKFGVVPREELPMNDSQYVGWKGMRFQEGRTAEVTWMLPEFGALAWQAHNEYLNLRGIVCGGRHPWYLVNLKHAPGEPLGAGNLKAIFANTCHRLGIGPPYNLHSLRHMYVTFLVEVLNLTLAQAQYLVRHCNITSTEKYISLSKELIRRAIEWSAKHNQLLKPLLGIYKND
jgi:integrase